jgi:prepilin-type N-terminal cleavage/methylation domain-containing protein
MMKPHRAAFTLIELAAALAVMGVLFGLAVQMLAVAAQQRRALARRSAALELASNLLERATTLAYDQVTVERLEQLASDLEPKLPGTRWYMDVRDARDSKLPAKRVTVRLVWDQSRGRKVPATQLMAWKYAPRQLSP